MVLTKKAEKSLKEILEGEINRIGVIGQPIFLPEQEDGKPLSKLSGILLPDNTICGARFKKVSEIDGKPVYILYGIDGPIVSPAAFQISIDSDGLLNITPKMSIIVMNKNGTGEIKAVAGIAYNAKVYQLPKPMYVRRS
ncbi:MAG: hypothetical protein OH319_03075 [Candidatus Parvarchaeota archaeon]|nr:hypothetical protein [Candidatus Jingweiarchaeum tengchongense]MCW1298477.1 hypothetical protein [Candidatus Jingweiarchaeum tengchongense]MCW1300277.1 hypothetical protein [Candidatus Jingweiarchaeum tengchongense]MCW1304488.1 hypothetical protein [Candidatus Jingweiarchaeum tengchongense]MCW1305783.1 hypothetical protein [Candidatus Jingweiarchaeum tengchongense]